MRQNIDLFLVSSALVGIIVLMIAVYEFDSMGSSTGNKVFSYITYLLGFTSIVVGLAMIYNGAMRALSNSTGIFGFIINLIFFLPCLVSDFVAYIKKEYNMTPSVVYILFLIEVFIISVMIATSYIPQLLSNLGGKNIISSPIFLDSSTVKSASNYVVDPTQNRTSLSDPIMRTNNTYAISLWTFVNQRTTKSATNFNIFSYGFHGNDASGNSIGFKPKLEFNGAMDGFKQNYSDTYNVTFVDNGPDYIIEAPSQKWNNFVFNYNGDSMDLFVNGILTLSYACIPNYNSTNDQFIMGENYGLYGAICNVNYYDKPLTIYEITAAYNLLNSQNPPIK